MPQAVRVRLHSATPAIAPQAGCGALRRQALRGAGGPRQTAQSARGGGNTWQEHRHIGVGAAPGAATPCRPLGGRG